MHWNESALFLALILLPMWPNAVTAVMIPRNRWRVKQRKECDPCDLPCWCISLSYFTGNRKKHCFSFKLNAHRFLSKGQQILLCAAGWEESMPKHQSEPSSFIYHLMCHLIDFTATVYSFYSLLETLARWSDPLGPGSTNLTEQRKMMCVFLRGVWFCSSKKVIMFTRAMQRTQLAASTSSVRERATLHRNEVAAWMPERPLSILKMDDTAVCVRSQYQFPPNW